MNLADTIRASLLHTYGNSTPSEVASSRFAAGASDAANAILDQLRGMGALELRQWLDNQIIDDEPEDERRRRHAGHGEDPFAQHDRDRITSLASETAQHEAALDQLDTITTDHGARLDRTEVATTELHSRDDSLESRWIEADQRLTNLQNTVSEATRTISQLQHQTSALTSGYDSLERELRTLRDSHLEHIGRGQLGMEPLHPEEHSHAAPYQDDDQRLGGHDQPHPNPPEDA